MLSEALRLLRVYHDLKQKELAAQLEISNSHISEIESGIKKPSMETIEKYSELFKVPVSSIMFFAEQIDKSSDDTNDDTKIENKAKRAIASKIIEFLKLIEVRTERRNA